MPLVNEPTHRCAIDAAHAWIGAAVGRMVPAGKPGKHGITLDPARGAYQEDTSASVHSLTASKEPQQHTSASVHSLSASSAASAGHPASVHSLSASSAASAAMEMIPAASTLAYAARRPAPNHQAHHTAHGITCRYPSLATRRMDATAREGRASAWQRSAPRSPSVQERRRSDVDDLFETGGQEVDDLIVGLLR